MYMQNSVAEDHSLLLAHLSVLKHSTTLILLHHSKPLLKPTVSKNVSNLSAVSVFVMWKWCVCVCVCVCVSWCVSVASAVVKCHVLPLFVEHGHCIEFLKDLTLCPGGLQN